MRCDPDRDSHRIIVPRSSSVVMEDELDHWSPGDGRDIMTSMKKASALIDLLNPYITRDRLLDTAVRLVEVPSRTGEARGALDRLAEILTSDGFEVERPA